MPAKRELGTCGRHLGHRVRIVGYSGGDITVARRDTCPVDHDIRDGVSQDFPRMTSGDHGNQQQPTSASAQVNGEWAEARQVTVDPNKVKGRRFTSCQPDREWSSTQVDGHFLPLETRSLATLVQVSASA